MSSSVMSCRLYMACRTDIREPSGRTGSVHYYSSFGCAFSPASAGLENATAVAVSHQRLLSNRLSPVCCPFCQADRLRLFGQKGNVRCRSLQLIAFVAVRSAMQIACGSTVACIFAPAASNVGDRSAAEYHCCTGPFPDGHGFAEQEHCKENC